MHFLIGSVYIYWPNCDQGNPCWPISVVTSLTFCLWTDFISKLDGHHLITNRCCCCNSLRGWKRAAIFVYCVPYWYMCGSCCPSYLGYLQRIQQGQRKAWRIPSPNNLTRWPWKSIGFQILLRTKYVPSLVKIHWRMLILECSQGCYMVKIWLGDLDLWPWKSIGFQLILRTKYVPSLVKIHWRMLILECSQGCYGRTEGSVTISLRNFVGEGIIKGDNTIQILTVGDSIEDCH